MTIDELKKKIEKLGLEMDRESGNILVEWEKIPFHESDRLYWAVLSSIDGVGPSTLPMLVSGFGSARRVLSAKALDLQTVGLSKLVIDRIQNIQKRSDLARSDLLKQWFKTLQFLVPADRKFPMTLRSLEHGPSQLWCWGDSSLLSHDRIVAIVGTRKITPYGKEISTMLAAKLGALGCVVVSGLMYGVDEAAMRGALSGGGKVIGVWAGGLTRASLGSRYRLARDVVRKGGVVISEFSPDHVPQKGLFLARNRIVSGLSRGVVVTEGAIKSGSLVTASDAMEQGKPVGAVPGPVTSATSAGPNELLKMGSTVITSAEEILAMCGLSSRSKGNETSAFKPQNRVQETIIAALSEQALTIDELVRQTTCSISETGEHLTNLELLDVVKQDGELWKLV